MPTAVATVKDTIVALWKAIPALANVAFILDGFGESSQASTTLILVGSNGNPDEEVNTEWQQVWANIAHTRRYETGQIPCCVVAQNGTTNQPVVQQAASTLMSACLTPFLADTTLGGVVFTAEVNEGTEKTITNSQGTAVIVPFMINYWAQV
jgi:hypothetical protein